MQCDFLVEPTAPDILSQNGLAKGPYQTLGTMTRCILHAANLGSEYWSFALVHAEYFKSHLLHQAINCPPYERYTRHRPSEKYLHIFGCPVTVRNPGRQPHKLDMHTST
jgi:hypothetical protein